MKMFAYPMLFAVAYAQTCQVAVQHAANDTKLASTLLGNMVTACQNGTTEVCLQQVQKANEGLTDLLNHIHASTKSCAGSSSSCKSGLHMADQYIWQAGSAVSTAHKDCTNADNKDECVMDTLNAATMLGHAAANVSLAKTSCAPALGGPVSCVKDIIAAIVLVKDAVTDIVHSVHSCKKWDRKGCKSSVEQDVLSVGKVLLQVTKAASSCGLIPMSACIGDIESAVSHVTSAVGDAKDAVKHCSHGIFNLSCFTHLLRVAAQTALGVTNIAFAVINCNPAL